MEVKFFISNLFINVQLDENLVNIKQLFNLFKKYSKPSISKNSLNVKIKNSKKRGISVSKDKKTLTISGYDIDNLYNPFNLIGILQAFFRFIGLHSIKNNIFLLHGSATIYKNKAICFADDGSSTAKTLGSIISSIDSGKYIGDEFCFLDNKYNIFSYDFIPLHIRDVVYKYLIKNHKNVSKIISKNEYKTKAGYFIDPKKIYKINKNKKLSAFIFIHFINNKKPFYKKLNNIESKKAVLNCISAHLIKFFNPQSDRMQFIAETDSTKKTPYKKKEINLIKKEIKLNGNIENATKKIACYQFYIKNPNDVLTLLKQIKF